MNNSKPFKVLSNNYETECANLYEVVKSIFQYPNIQQGQSLESRLYACAFAYICKDFVCLVDEIECPDYFDFLMHDMKFYDDDFELFQKGLTSETLNYVPESLGEMVWAIIQDYQKIIKSDLRKLLKDDEKIAAFFGSIYGFNDCDYFIEMVLDHLEFCNDF